MYEDTDAEITLPVQLNSKFILGSEGAHLNISGISGLASKTSYAMFLMKAIQKAGEDLGLTADELAFYDALTKPQAIKDFYENEELIAITKELADKLRKSRLAYSKKKLRL